ncbi:hypothetical protein FRC12_004984 [Ceratobasidium sp. 428]|nr:hypothetical protein FRC12_004984 [Ceratobasidium sp. 428]
MEVGRDQPAGTNSSWSVISGVTPLSNVVSLLVQHGCLDITHKLDLPSCSEHPISTGGFGDIYRGRLGEGLPVAIKCMRIVIDSAVDEQQKHLKYAAREINTWSKLEHQYISKLLGLAQFRGQLAMLSPWAERGSLPLFLARNPLLNRPLLCTQIAEGLDFLHQCGIVHGDLKGSNILISDKGEPLLADFGNAVLQEHSLDFTDTSSKKIISLRWAAPELLGLGKYSTEADVYALGMTILETISGSVPYFGMKDVSVVNAILSGRLPTRPEHMSTASKDGDSLWLLLNRCWAFNPGSRPTAAEVKAMMAGITPEGLAYWKKTREGGISKYREGSCPCLCADHQPIAYFSEQTSGEVSCGDEARARAKAGRAMNVVQELLSTERRYVETLELMETEYRTTAPTALVECLQLLIEVSRTLVEYLETDFSVQGACNAFLAVEEQFETAFVRWSVLVPSAISWVRAASKNSESERKLSLDMIAVMPTQRVARLALLFHQIESHTPSAALLQPLAERAVQAARRVARRCDEAREDADDILPPT